MVLTRIWSRPGLEYRQRESGGNQYRWCAFVSTDKWAQPGLTNHPVLFCKPVSFFFSALPGVPTRLGVSSNPTNSRGPSQCPPGCTSSPGGLFSYPLTKMGVCLWRLLAFFHLRWNRKSDRRRVLPVHHQKKPRLNDHTGRLFFL